MANLGHNDAYVWTAGYVQLVTDVIYCASSQKSGCYAGSRNPCVMMEKKEKGNVWVPLEQLSVQCVLSLQEISSFLKIFYVDKFEHASEEPQDKKVIKL